jgi:HTH-type transcriptional regulator/antitoxin HipB
MSNIVNLDLTEVGREILLARQRAHLTQSQLAERAGVTRQTVAALEHGTIGDLGVRKLIRLLDVLDLTLAIRPRGHPVTLDDLRPGKR